MKEKPITLDCERISGAGGLKILVRSWRPEYKPRAVVAVCPGVNSHSGYYLWAAGELVASGVAVYAVDLHGHGESDGERFYSEKIEDFVTDVDALVTLAKSREPGLPVFLFGHGVGGVISCIYALEHQAKLAGLICESFAFQGVAPELSLSVLRALSQIAPHARMVQLKNEDFSRDPIVVRAMNADRRLDKEVQPLRIVSELIRATERLTSEFPLITLPLLILHGTADKVTRPAGSQVFHDTAGSADKTLRLYDGHVHDLLNDYDREDVMTDIKQWIWAHLPAVRASTRGQLPDLDHAAIHEWDGDAVPLGVDGDIGRRAARLDDRASAAATEEMQTGVALTGRQHEVAR
jgi:acylglycerol lipase